VSGGLDTEWVLRLVLFSIVHWILAGVMLNDLSSRRRVFARHKAPWALIIIFIPCFGSLLYLIFHPQIIDPSIIKRGRHDKDDRE